MEVSFGSLTPRLHFSTQPTFLEYDQAKAAVCYLALFPGHLEKLLQVLQRIFDELPWTLPKQEYMQEQYAMILAEREIQVNPKVEHIVRRVNKTDCEPMSTQFKVSSAVPSNLTWFHS